MNPRRRRYHRLRRKRRNAWARLRSRDCSDLAKAAEFFYFDLEFGPQNNILYGRASDTSKCPNFPLALGVVLA